MKIGKFCYSKKDMRRAAALLRMDDLAVLEKRSEAALAALYDASISVHSDKIDIPTAIIRRSDTSLRRSSAKRMIAVLAASLVLIFAMTMAVSASARQMTLDFIRRVFPEEDRVSYEFNEDRNIQNPNQLPELTLNVPAGYVLKKSSRSPFSAHYYYETEDQKNGIVLDYALLNSDSEIGLEWDTSVRETVYILDYIADYYPPGNRSSQGGLIWIDEKNGVVIALASTLSKEEIIKMAESIYR